MSRLTRDGTAEPVSRDQILRHARGQGNIHFPCSADHEQDWQPYPVDPYSAICDDHTYIHTYIQTSTFEDLNAKIHVKNEIQQPETTRVLPVLRLGQQICLYCGENHDIIFSPLMIFVSTTAGNQRSFRHAILQSFSTQAK